MEKLQERHLLCFSFSGADDYAKQAGCRIVDEVLKFNDEEIWINLFLREYRRMVRSLIGEEVRRPGTEAEAEVLDSSERRTDRSDRRRRQQELRQVKFPCGEETTILRVFVPIRRI